MRTQLSVALLSFAVLCAVSGCGDSGSGAPAADLGTVPAADMTMGTPILPDGEYHLGLELAPFSGLRLREKLKVTVTGERGKGGAFKKVELWALGTGDPKWQSEKPVVTVSDQAIDKDGKFKIDFGMLTLPGMASPTGSDVLLSLVITGTISDDGTFCGAVDGMVPAFQAPLAGSAFKAVPWGTEKSPYESSCQGGAAKVYKHIETCPATVVGTNKLRSAELDRTFEVRTSSKGVPQTPVPLVFLFHGVGGSAAGILADTRFEALLGKNEFVLVAPDSARENGMASTLDWEFQLEHFDLDNRDLVFFDDMITCISTTWKIDPKRIYVTGMSGGGLMSTFLAANRAKAVAAAAPMSGGYIFKWPSAAKTPVMVTWGGPTDMAFQQNFDTLAKNLSAALSTNGNTSVKCEHMLGHKWPPEMTAAAWSWLSSFTLGGNEKPFMGPLPAPFPAYCAIAP